MRIVRRLDAGPVADAERVTIAPLDTALEVEAKLAAACVPLVARALPRLARGELRFADQDETAVTFCRKLSKEDGVLDFAAPAAVLAARINGLFPWPACGVELGGQPIKFGLADAIAADHAMAPGQVVGADEAGLLVATAAGVLRVRRVQRPGGRMLAAAEFLRGFPIPAGTQLQAKVMPVLVTRG
jgi:methionyl-tRNA formyltransferase